MSYSDEVGDGRKRLLVKIGDDRPGNSHDVESIEHNPHADYVILTLPEAVADRYREQGRKELRDELRRLLGAQVS